MNASLAKDLGAGASVAKRLGAGDLLAKRLGAGALLAAMQTTFALVRWHHLFLTPREVLEFALTTLLALSASVLLLGALLEPALPRGSQPSRLAGVWFPALAAAFAGWAGWSLTEGRRVRELWFRPLLVLGLALVAAAALWLVLRALRRVRAAPLGVRRGWLVAGAVSACGCLAIDSLVLPRGYPAFHLSLFAGALLAITLAAEPLELFPSERLERGLRWAALLVVIVAPMSLWHLARQPNTSYATLESAAFTAKLLRPFLQRSDVSEPAFSATQAASEQPLVRGVDLRDRDVLMITVDAMRADLLSAWGGSGLTPEIDKLAAESLRFRRAYTPAPHTSYALASLLTAKFIKPVTELANASQDHATLPDLLRRYSYRTAAFYPPAVFYVDGARFQALQARGFGFEYRKEMFASAEQRVEQLSAYLAQAEPGHPLFIWMHLFEPHEPYEPPQDLIRVDSARGRYEGEVRFCDRAIAKLVQTFRATRPQGTVIISADHGEEFGDHGGSYHGSTLYEEQVHVPLLWSSPGAVAPGDSDVPVELVDVGASILSTAGIPREARMRGDDLAGVLAGLPTGPKFAFASVEERHMVTDGRYKAVCSASEAHCQLFDLQADPKERQNLAGREPERVAALRRELFAFLSSIAKREVMGVEQGVGFPEPLVRARLSAPGAGPDVIPLLKDPRPVVRAASARILGELKIAAALPALLPLRDHDAEAAVRDEAAVAALLLGDEASRDAAVALLTRADAQLEGLSLRRRAALALSPHGEVRAVPILAELLNDASVQESDRLHAALALSAIGDASAVPALIAALGQVRLCETVARALGAIGGKEAGDALLAQLEGERYEPARAAEAAALVQLGDRRVIAQIQRFLGMETSIPSGVQLLSQWGALSGGGRRGAAKLEPSLRRGGWECAEHGCVPGADARIVLPAVEKPSRVTFVVTAEPNALLALGDISVRCAGGEQQVSLSRARGQGELAVRSEGRIAFGAWVMVPETAEIPPPEPEPWDAGVDAVSPE